MSSETLDSPNIEMAPVLRPKNALTRADQHMEVARRGKLVFFNRMKHMKTFEDYGLDDRKQMELAVSVHPGGSSLFQQISENTKKED